MPVTIEKLPDDPIVLITARNPIDLKIDMPDAISRLQAILEASDRPLWDVTDALGFTISFPDLVAMLGTVSRADLGLVRHRNFAGIALAADSDLLRMGLNALGQAQYGGILVKSFATLDEAMAFARSEVAAKA
jgi:hypothetical protein